MAQSERISAGGILLPEQWGKICCGGHPWREYHEHHGGIRLFQKRLLSMACGKWLRLCHRDRGRAVEDKPGRVPCDGEDPAYPGAHIRSQDLLADRRLSLPHRLLELDSPVSLKVIP